MIKKKAEKSTLDKIELKRKVFLAKGKKSKYKLAYYSLDTFVCMLAGAIFFSIIAGIIFGIIGLASKISILKIIVIAAVAYGFLATMGAASEDGMNKKNPCWVNKNIMRIKSRCIRFPMYPLVWIIIGGSIISVLAGISYGIYLQVGPVIMVAVLIVGLILLISHLRSR